MSALEIMKDLFFIERGYLNSNHFVYCSKEPILIDTAYISDFEITERLISDLGADLSRTRLIINTHTHCDHIGGNRTIQERSDCDIALHKIGKYFIDTRDDWSTWWRYYSQDAAFFDCSLALEDGDLITVGPHEFRVIHTPGHASDGIVLYGAKDKVLLSSDTLWESDMGVMTIRVEGSTALFHMLESLEKLESLDVEVVFPGHGKPFKDIKGAISRSKKRVQSFMKNKENIGTDLLKKIMIYTLLMQRKIDEDRFYGQLMETYWFRETIDLYFDKEYKQKYDELITDFFNRGIVRQRDGKLFTTIKP